MSKTSGAQRRAQRITSQTTTSQDQDEETRAAYLPDAREAAPNGIDDLLNIASHELRSPITPLKMRLQQTHRRLQREGGRERDVDDLAKALYHLERLQQQIALFLDTASLTHGSLSLAPRLGDLHETARRLTDIYASAGLGRAIQLEGPGEPLTGVWDSARLDVALRELLGNALKYTTGDITLRLWRQGEFARVEVEDAGPAMSVSLRDRVFEPYVTGCQGNHGVGLGLYVAREIIRLHGGEMGVCASSSGGSIFWLTLPLE